MLCGCKQGSERSEGNKAQIKRPDAQDSPQIKAVEIQVSRGRALTQEQTGDEVGAQGEKKVHAISTAREDGDGGCGDPSWNLIAIIKAGDPRKSMEEEHSEECKKPQGIEFRTIEAPLMVFRRDRSERRCNGGAHRVSVFLNPKVNVVRDAVTGK